MEIRVNIKPNIQFRAFYIFFIIVGIQNGVGVLEAPAKIFPYAKQDAWISILLVFLYMIILFFVMLLILNQYKQTDLFGIHVDLFGHFFGKFLGILLILFFFINILSVLVRYIEIITLFLYPILPPYIIAISVIGLSIYCVLGGMKVIVGACFFYFIFTQILVLLLYYPISTMDFNHLLPLFQANLPDILQSAKEVTYSYLGLEILLVIYPFISDKTNVKKPAILALMYTTAILLVSLFISMGYYSFHTLERISYPTLTLFRGISFPFIERIDYFIVVEWMMVILPNCFLCIWAITYGLKRLFNLKQRKTVYVIGIMIIIMTSFTYPKIITDQFLKVSAEIGFWFMYVYPLLLLPIVIIKKKLKQGRGQ